MSNPENLWPDFCKWEVVPVAPESAIPVAPQLIIDYPAPPLSWIKALEAGLIQSVKFSMVGTDLRAEIEFNPQLDTVGIPAQFPVFENEGKKS